jgi:hypothetical protein
MTTVRDNGPPQGTPEYEKWQKEPAYKLWKKQHPEAKVYECEMSPVDAVHAVEADPERYEMVHSDQVNLYDIGAPRLMERKAAEALVALDKHRYSIKDHAHPDAPPEKHDPKRDPPPPRASLQHK